MAKPNVELMHEFFQTHGHGNRKNKMEQRMIIIIIIIIIIVRILPSWTIFQYSTVNFCKPRGPQHTYYYIVVIIVAGKWTQEREMKYTFN